jgi:hypothetical protein
MGGEETIGLLPIFGAVSGDDKVGRVDRVNWETCSGP